MLIYITIIIVATVSAWRHIELKTDISKLQKEINELKKMMELE